MPLFASLRSKKNRRGSLSSTGTAPAAASDFGPTSPSRASLASAKQANGTGNGKGQAGKGQLGTRPSAAQLGGNAAPSGLPTIPASSTEPAVGSNASDAGKDANAAPAPRPSELFAGKGVQWDSVRLAGPQARLGSAVPNPQAGTSEDLQSFLKARRQWVPTFVTEDEKKTDRAAPSDLSKINFDAPREAPGARDGHLLSLAELDASHKRKQALLGTSGSVLGNSLFDEPSTSAQGAAAVQAQQQQQQQQAAGTGKPPSIKSKMGRGPSWRKSSSTSHNAPVSASAGAAAAAASRSASTASKQGATSAHGKSASAGGALPDGGGGGEAGGNGHDEAIARALAQQHQNTAVGTTTTTTIRTTTSPDTGNQPLPSDYSKQPLGDDGPLGPRSGVLPARKPVPARESSVVGADKAAVSSAQPAETETEIPNSSNASAVPAGQANGDPTQPVEAPALARPSTDNPSTRFATPEVPGDETTADDAKIPGGTEAILSDQPLAKAEAV